MKKVRKRVLSLTLTLALLLSSMPAVALADNEEQDAGAVSADTTQQDSVVSADDAEGAGSADSTDTAADAAEDADSADDAQASEPDDDAQNTSDEQPLPQSGEDEPAEVSEPLPEGQMDGFGANTAFSDMTLEQVTARLVGSGTQSSPYRIYTAEEFYLINYVEYWHEYLDLGPVYYRQMDDIDLSSFAWEDSRCTSYVMADFSGVFDGSGYAFLNADRPLFYWITGTYIGADDLSGFAAYQAGDYAELFTAQVVNVTVKEPNIGDDAWGDRAAVAQNARYAALYNCRVQGGEIASTGSTAGILSRGYGVAIDSCTVDDVTLSPRASAAGIALEVHADNTDLQVTSSSIIINCKSSGTYTASSYGAGIVRVMDDACGRGSGGKIYFTGAVFCGILIISVCAPCVGCAAFSRRDRSASSLFL